MVNKGGELLDVKIVDVGVDMAYACSVASAKFEYKGTPNDDVFVLTTIFKKDADKWKICLAAIRLEESRRTAGTVVHARLVATKSRDLSTRNFSDAQDTLTKNKVSTHR